MLRYFLIASLYLFVVLFSSARNSYSGTATDFENLKVYSTADSPVGKPEVQEPCPFAFSNKVEQVGSDLHGILHCNGISGSYTSILLKKSNYSTYACSTKIWIRQRALLL